MNARQLQYFVTAAECGSFTQAAERLYTTQPGFSKQIAALEKELGFRLFFREHRSVCLTDAGRRYYELVKDVPALLTRAKAAALELTKQEDLDLSIAILEGHQLSSEILAAMERFRVRHEEVRMRFVRGDFDALRNELLSHSLDVAFTIGFTLEREPGVRLKVLRRQSSYLAVSRRSPLTAKTSVRLSALGGETFVLLDEAVSPVSYRNLTAMLAEAGIPSGQIIRVNSSESLFTSVEAGLGIAIVDGENRLRQSANAVLIPLEGDAAPPNLCAAWLAENRKRVLDEFIREL